MLNIQLYLENQEVELNDSVSFPLTKSFENIWNPTDITVDYSKSINIPATNKNNKLMANAYRLDRSFNSSETTTNLGIYLDPLKRIPMQLVYNNDILLDGYAKYSSATTNDKGTYYTFNLYGALGDVFQKLLDCVINENMLNDAQKAEDDNGEKYILKESWAVSQIDRHLVEDCWKNDTPKMDSGRTDDSIGFAPAFRGQYSNFSSDSALGLTWNGDASTKPTDTASIEESLKSVWKSRSGSDESIKEAIDSIDFSYLVPDGINEHVMRQFRSYEQRPYIYFHALMNMFRDKCEELTGYTINLDPNWFSVNNPYWSRLCYMLDYISIGSNAKNTSNTLTSGSTQTFTNRTTHYLGGQVKYNVNRSLLSSGEIRLEPFNVKMNAKYKFEGNTSPYRLEMDRRAAIAVHIKTTTNSLNTVEIAKFWGATVPANRAYRPDGYTNDEFILLTQDTKIVTGEDLSGSVTMTVPRLTIPVLPTAKGVTLSIEFRYYDGVEWVNYEDDEGHPIIDMENYDWRVRPGNSYESIDEINVSPEINNSNFTYTLPSINYVVNWRNTMTSELKNLYSKDEPLFNVILQYTKMFGLIWKPNYQNKTIDIMTRPTYFKDYKIVDWTNKVDKSKGMTIEPVSFKSKYLIFNYEDVNGNNYSDYKNKYGIAYGSKKLKTKYNFDTAENKVFKNKIYPSSVSNRSIITKDELLSWSFGSGLVSQTTEVSFIDGDSEDRKSNTSFNNWYFRNLNKDTINQYYITDASSWELDNNKYCWLGENMIYEYGCGTPIYYLPQFSPVSKSTVDAQTVGCLFSCPNEDYTSDNSLEKAKGNFIYDVCWSDYINERYNANNKKLTCYVKLTVNEFNNFNHKTFVVVDNQLFVVNKIYDFDFKNTYTKVDLIQVTNIDGYTKQKIEFPPIVTSASRIVFNSELLNKYYFGNCSISVSNYPEVSYEIRKINAHSSSQLYVEDAEREGNITSLYMTYESDAQQFEQWELVLGKETDYGVTIPILINPELE